MQPPGTLPLFCPSALSQHPAVRPSVPLCLSKLQDGVGAIGVPPTPEIPLTPPVHGWGVLRTCNKPNKPNEAPKRDCTHLGMGGSWGGNRGSNGVLEGGGIPQDEASGVHEGGRGGKRGGEEVRPQRSHCLSGGTRTHFGLPEPTLGVPLPILVSEDPFWGAIAHPGHQAQF